MSLYLINREDFKAYINIRRENFKKLLNQLSNIEGLKPVFRELPDGVVPFYFPIRVSSLADFNRLCHKYLIEYARWPTYPKSVKPIPAFENVVFIPIHEKLDPTCFKYYGRIY